MTIRRATAADTPALVRMACQFIASSPYRDLVDANPAHQRQAIAWLLGQQSAALALLLVAEGDAGPVGMLAMAIVPSPVSGALVATELAWWLDPAARRGSTGVRLWEQAERWAADHDAVYVHMVAPHGTAVGAMYQRRGYLPLETVWQKRVAA
jgi:GNAT superfamily N-acetyltransferase